MERNSKNHEIPTLALACSIALQWIRKKNDMLGRLTLIFGAVIKKGSHNWQSEVRTAILNFSLNFMSGLELKPIYFRKTFYSMHTLQWTSMFLDLDKGLLHIKLYFLYQSSLFKCKSLDLRVKQPDILGREIILSPWK